MPAITISDLSNAKLDVDHIAEFANGLAATVTDRTGNTKTSISGAAAEIAAAISGMKTFNARGAFAPGVEYAIKDLYTGAGIVYVVVVAHTSTSIAGDLAIGNVAVYQGITSDALEASGGSSMLGFIAAGGGAVRRTAQDKMRDSLSIKDCGASGAGVGDDLPAINSAIADQVRGAVSVPAGDYLVSNFPTNLNGVQFDGPGRILKAITGGNQQINTYADRYQHITGREYMAAFHRRIIDGNGCNIVLTGDSTTVGGNIADLNWRPDGIIKKVAAACGIRSQFTFNRGQGGAHSGQWETTFVAGDIAVATAHLFIVRWGINDPTFGRTLEQFIASMRAGLSAIRASYPVGSASILLMAPNSTSDTPSGRDEKWNEQVTPALRKMARDFQCAFFDTYAWCKDSRGAANVWMDDPYADGRAIHPLDVMNAAIFSGVADILYPRSLAPALNTDTTLTLLNGWVEYADSYLIQAKRRGNLVKLNGLIKSGTITGGMGLCSLPGSMAPSQNMWFSCPTDTTPALIYVRPDGTVVGHNIPSNGLLSLDGISFFI